MPIPNYNINLGDELEHEQEQNNNIDIPDEN